MTPAVKKKSRKDKLSKKAKMEIITQVLIEKPGAHLKRGFQKALRDMFKAPPYNVNVSVSYMSELLKEVLEGLERGKTYLHSKKWYQLQYQRLFEEEHEAQDIVGQKQTLRDMAKLDGHLAGTDGGGAGDPEIAKELDQYYKDNKKGGSK